MYQTDVTSVPMLFSCDIFRIVRLFLGLFICAFGVVMTLQANLGFSPWDVFHQGVANHLGLTIGRAAILVSAVVVLTVVSMKESIGFGTLCNMISLGLFMDMLLFWGGIPLMRGFISGVAMLIGGLFVIGVGTVLYMGAGYSAGPRDSLMVVIAKRTGKPIGLCRVGIEGTALAIGWILGGHAGFGTVISAFGIGFAVQVVFSILRFDVRKVRQESFHETFLRLRNMACTKRT